MIFNDRRNARALKAANGPSLAPKGYKPDTAGRAAVNMSVKGAYLGKPGEQNNQSQYLGEKNPSRKIQYSTMAKKQG